MRAEQHSRAAEPTAITHASLHDDHRVATAWPPHGRRPPRGQRGSTALAPREHRVSQPLCRQRRAPSSRALGCCRLRPFASAGYRVVRLGEHERERERVGHLAPLHLAVRQPPQLCRRGWYRIVSATDYTRSMMRMQQNARCNVVISMQQNARCNITSMQQSQRRIISMQQARRSTISMQQKARCNGSSPPSRAGMRQTEATRHATTRGRAGGMRCAVTLHSHLGRSRLANSRLANSHLGGRHASGPRRAWRGRAR